MSVTEALRDLTHADAVDYLALFLREKRLYVRTEVKLPNGRRADVMSRDATGEVTCWEVKTWYRPALCGMSAAKYGRWANRLMMVYSDPPNLFALDWQRHGLDLLGFEACGLAVITRERLSVMRTPPARNMRKSDSDLILKILS